MDRIYIKNIWGGATISIQSVIDRCGSPVTEWVSQCEPGSSWGETHQQIWDGATSRTAGKQQLLDEQRYKCVGTLPLPGIG